MTSEEQEDHPVETVAELLRSIIPFNRRNYKIHVSTDHVHEYSILSVLPDDKTKTVRIKIESIPNKWKYHP